MNKILTIIIISRTADSMSRCLEAIANSTTLSFESYNVICSWNGEDQDIDLISVPEGMDFSCKIIKPYGFSHNNNQIAKDSESPLLLFINDDVILDPNSLDNALKHIRHESVGMVGANLRYETGRIQHAGVFFDEETNLPYHRFKGKIEHDDQLVQQSCFVPSLTGAFLLIRNTEFKELLFDESFKVAGEDIVLSSQYTSRYPRRLLYAADVKAVHIENETRKITGDKVTPLEDQEVIRKVIKSRKPQKKLKVRIVTEKPGWIMHRKAQEISNNSNFLDVVINEECDDADIHYYINYGYFNKRPKNGVVIGNFTHYDKAGLGEKFKSAAESMDYCIAVSELTKRELLNFGINESKISVVKVGADRTFKPKLLLGVVGRVYPGGRKGEDLINKALKDSEVMDVVELVATNDSWGVPILKCENNQTFYRAIDYLLVPSLIEGGPVPFMEALASGTLSIAPHLGVVPEHTHIPYENGNYESLRTVLIRLADEHITNKYFFADEMKGLDWENWGFEHEKIFTDIYIKNLHKHHSQITE